MFCHYKSVSLIKIVMARASHELVAMVLSCGVLASCVKNNFSISFFTIFLLY